VTIGASGSALRGGIGLLRELLVDTILRGLPDAPPVGLDINGWRDYGCRDWSAEDPTRRRGRPSRSTRHLLSDCRA